MGKYRIRFNLKEWHNPFDKERLSGIMNLILEKSFGDYEEMCVDIDKFDFIPFDEITLLKVLERRKYFSVILRSEATEEYFEGNLSITLISEKDKNLFEILIDHEDFIASGEVDKFYSFIRKISKMFTKISQGITDTVGFNAKKYYRKHKLERLKTCFNEYIHWIHILGASHYEAHGYSKEDLLKAPAYKIEEWENDTIFMMSYKDPFFWDEESTIKQIIKLNNYLLDKAEDIQW